jgi:hypothetical protein
VRHEAEIREDDETGEEAGETVDSSSHEAVPVRTDTSVLRDAFGHTRLAHGYLLRGEDARTSAHCTHR